ncbi:hypothetical protein Wildcat_134 [Mycobacterium phage Wildcat]|uniref:YspA cpYpsA-related SLOG domain-containing protein n=3 Tax=Mycobacterium virus Wildcat TaxID=1993859 RepID=Q19XV0_9CAUD|nr:GTP-binding domain [Mycobacterium phage Wildcat]ABE67714.1 hypothetical protein Wildcat_134 [Mycobacterium phage Wildcat]AJD82182.1 hypothetical protein COSMO_135 [Mycobacterium phage Cosmo]QGJ89995.1 DprA-like DNA processing chain A [Mycobacterium phage MaryV]WKR36116.1 DprA-like DNA processing protein [Mycobacterium phage Azrael100]
MRVLISGSRNWPSFRMVQNILNDAYWRAEEAGDLPLRVRHGNAPGADTCAAAWVRMAQRADWDVYNESFPAEWQHEGCTHPKGVRNGDWYCKAAGPLRNQRMLDHPGRIDEAHFFPAEDSRGTWDMWDRAEAAGIPCFNHGAER